MKLQQQRENSLEHTRREPASTHQQCTVVASNEVMIHSTSRNSTFARAHSIIFLFLQSNTHSFSYYKRHAHLRSRVTCADMDGLRFCGDEQHGIPFGSRSYIPNASFLTCADGARLAKKNAEYEAGRPCHTRDKYQSSGRTKPSIDGRREEQRRPEQPPPFPKIRSLYLNHQRDTHLLHALST